jgi:type VI secretion system secreted protein VgrG
MTNDVVQDFDMAGAVGAKATLRADREDGRPPHFIHGIFAAVELIHAHAGRAVIRATLVPRLWKLTQSIHSNVFTDKTIPDILKEVLAQSGVTDHAFRLFGSYPAQEHVCQYRESDFAFLSRWMEREGIYYYFEQGESEERLIITDERATHGPLVAKPVRYFPQTGEAMIQGEVLRTFMCRHTSLPASVRLKDYDYAHPALDISGRAPVAPGGFGEISIYGARFFTPAEGGRLAKLKAEALLAGQVVYHGAGTTFGLRPGYTFEVEEHPLPAFNTKYLATEVEHFGNQATGAPELRQIAGLVWDETYRVEVSAIPASVQYRAPQVTPWPRIYGTEHAIVDGPADSVYAQLDDQGRYSIKLSFDESDLTGGKASTKVRMLQPHGGGIEGFHFPLRKGTEVLCTFLGGDPDRPVIAGVAPNALAPSPVTAANYTLNVLQTGGRNRLELEDKDGSQRVTLSTPTENTMLRIGAPNDDHNLIARTDGSGLIHSGKNLDVNVLLDKSVTVQGSVKEEYTGPQSTTVGADVTRLYKANKTESVAGGHVGETYGTHRTVVNGPRDSEYGSHSLTVHALAVTDAGEQSTTVQGPVTEVYKADHTTTVTGARTETIEGVYTQTVKGAATQTLEGGWKVDVTGDVNHTATGAYTITAKEFEAKYDGDFYNLAKGTKIEIVLGSGVTAVLGTQTDFFAPLKAEVIAGLKFETILGAALQIHLGLAFTMAPVAIEMTNGADIRSAFVQIFTAPLKLAVRPLQIDFSDLEIHL